MKHVSHNVFFAISILFLQSSIHTYHFMYQPGRSCNTTHIHTDHPMNIKIWIQGGSTSKSRNNTSHKTELLNIYGNEKLAYMFQGVELNPLVGSTYFNVADAMNAHDTTGFPSDYATIITSGKFSTASFGLSFETKLTEHFSIKACLPVSHFKIKDVELNYQGITDGEAIQLQETLPTILEKYNLQAGDVKDTTLGDIQLFSVATFERPADEHLGYASLQLSTGITVPSSHQKKITQAFYIPMGNNGHTGFSLNAKAKLALYEQIALKVSGSVEMFLKHDDIFRMKTDNRQNGFLKLQQGEAREKLGTKFDVNAAVCAHGYLLDTLGGYIQYRYERQGTTTLTPVDTTIFNETTVNNDESLKAWQRHTLIFGLSYTPEYDYEYFTPRFALSYSQPVSGKRIFNAFSLSGSAGINFSLDF